MVLSYSGHVSAGWVVLGWQGEAEGGQREKERGDVEELHCVYQVYENEFEFESMPKQNEDQIIG